MTWQGDGGDGEGSFEGHKIYLFVDLAAAAVVEQ
jgi:hypothetical protein